MKKRVVVFLEGGIVQEIKSTEGMEVLIVDRDTDGADACDIYNIKGDDAYVYSTRRSIENKTEIDEIYNEFNEQMMERCKK
ncbi:hypothetical protein [Bacillus altitudinis]|uniref:hypothetical protein n=1 Tax=Bacillus altitudinis TaxID=293387 RepID=UPI0039BFCF58